MVSTLCKGLQGTLSIFAPLVGLKIDQDRTLLTIQRLYNIQKIAPIETPFGLKVLGRIMWTPEKELETLFETLMSYPISINADTIHSSPFSVSRASRQSQGTGNHHGCTPPDLVLVLRDLIKVRNAPQRDWLAFDNQITRCWSHYTTSAQWLD